MSELTSEFCQKIDYVAQLFRIQKLSIALTGAGISTPSGIPDFRSPGSGLWERFDPFEVASLRTFRYNPEKLFAWFRPLASTIKHALPNPAHRALARLEQKGYLQTIITQNIDGLHQQAGSRQVLEIHGSLQTFTCSGCYEKFGSGDYIKPYLELGEIPSCPKCHHILKPDVVLFEEELPIKVWQRAESACKKCDLFLVIGSSLEVLPAAKLPLRAIENGAQLVIVNQMPTYLDERAQVVIRGDVADILPRIACEVIGD
jgi:NAD-dependent deacetylase